MKLKAGNRNIKYGVKYSRHTRRYQSLNYQTILLATFSVISLFVLLFLSYQAKFKLNAVSLFYCRDNVMQRREVLTSFLNFRCTTKWAPNTTSKISVA